MTLWRNLVVALVAAFVLTACGGSSDAPVDPPTAMPDPDPEPSAYETAKAAIAAATTAAAAQAAYDAVKDDVTAAQGAMLQDAVDMRVAALATMDRADMQRTALMTAAGMIDTSDLSTQALVDAAEAAIEGLKAAIADAVDVDDTSMYQARVDAAETLVSNAQSTLDHASQTMALSDAVGDLQAIDLTDLSTQAKIDAAEAAIAAVRDALAAATELSAAEKTAAMTEVATADRTVMAAQGNFDTAAQKTGLDEAVATLAALDLDNLMTQEQIDAAVAAITGVNLALAAATNLTDAEKLDATVDVTVAQRKVDRAEETLTANVDSQRTALMKAVAALGMIDLDDLDTAEKIAAANTAITALQAALDGATHLSDAEKAAAMTDLNTATETVRTAQTGMDRDGRMMAQRTAITDAVTMARTAVNAVNNDSTDAQVTAADNAVAALKAAIDGADDLPEGDADVAMAQGTLETLETQLASAKTNRMTAIDNKRKADNAAMMATAAKLWKGIAAQNGNPTTTAADNALAAGGERAAAYNDVDVPESGVAIDTRIMVGVGTADPVALSEDKKAPDAKLHGWEGKRYTAEPDDDGMYEAMVYSNVGEPTEGDPFNEKYTLNAADAANPGELPITGDVAKATARIASSSFDQSAGTKEFKLPTNAVRVMLSGSYHGVSGTYYCTPAASSTCAAQVAADGFTLGGTADADNAFTAGGGTWTFKPGTATAKVESMPDAIYASYGWWIHRSEDGNAYTASAFADVKGDVPAAAALDTLQGTATYTGGAAGKYALSSSTGGTNDAGHFTARATLNADFSDNSITGTIDTFMGADGMSRDWSVELKEAAIAATGGITRTGTDQTDNDTAWTIGEDAADASGEWSGMLYDNGDDGVPKVGTGTFYTEYGTAGKMIGAFGVNKQ